MTTPATLELTYYTIRDRYEAYRLAIELLAANYTTVSARKEAIQVRDAFERDVRNRLLDSVFGL